MSCRIGVVFVHLLMTGGGHSGEGSLKLFKLGSVGKLWRANPLHFYTTSLHSTIQDSDDGTQLSEKNLPLDFVHCLNS